MAEQCPKIVKKCCLAYPQLMRVTRPLNSKYANYNAKIQYYSHLIRNSYFVFLYNFQYLDSTIRLYHLGIFNSIHIPPSFPSKVVTLYKYKKVLEQGAEKSICIPVPRPLFVFQTTYQNLCSVCQTFLRLDGNG